MLKLYFLFCILPTVIAIIDEAYIGHVPSY